MNDKFDAIVIGAGHNGLVAAATLAMAENGGGLYGIEEAVCAITILGR